MVTQTDFTPELQAKYRGWNRGQSIEFFIMKRGAHYADIDTLLRDWQEYNAHDIRADWHGNGVHTACEHRHAKANLTRGSHRDCPYAGKVERHHTHDYAGPLVCGCAE